MGLMGPTLRHSEQQRMEQLIRAELGDVLDTSDLESVTSKEVGGEPEMDCGCCNNSPQMPLPKGLSPTPAQQAFPAVSWSWPLPPDLMEG